MQPNTQSVLTSLAVILNITLGADITVQMVLLTFNPFSFHCGVPDCQSRMHTMVDFS